MNWTKIYTVKYLQEGGVCQHSRQSGQLGKLGTLGFPQYFTIIMAARYPLFSWKKRRKNSQSMTLSLSFH